MITTSGFAQSLSGTYYIGEVGSAPEGSNPDFSSLHEAVQALYESGLEADVTFLISSDLDETENIFLGLDTQGHTITISPAPETVPVVTFSRESNNSNINGAFVIGVSSDNWEDVVPTANIVIDGSNDGSPSRHLTLITSENAGTSNFFRIVGAVDNLVWRNTNVSVQQQSFDTILISPLQRNDEDFVPSNIVIENNEIASQQSRTSSRAINVWGVSGDGFNTPVTVPGPIIIQNNDITARRYGVWLRTMGGNSNITGNTIQINEPGTLGAYGILISEVLDESVEVEISANLINKLRSGGVIRGISLEAQGVYHLFNNMITGFEASDEGEDVEFYGVHVQTPPSPETIDVLVYQNTIFMNPLSAETNSSWRYRGFQSNSNVRISVDFKNNIIINADDTDATSYAYFQFGTATELTSDYNNIFVANPSEASNTYFGRLSGSGGENMLSLSEWQTETELDLNSASVDVQFESATDLSLADGMQHVEALKAPRLASVPVDFFGNNRPDPTFKGAHEPEPSVNTERNQEVASSIKLHQNYPNPFNPSTTISFDLNKTGLVQLQVFTVDGRLVSTLINNEIKSAGTHYVSFDASGLSSGMYLYRLIAGNSAQTGRMMLIK